jgi:hypothetical protein
MIVPCNTTVDVIFNFGGKNFTIPPNAYILGPISSNGVDVEPIDTTRGICMSGFSSGNDGKQSLLDCSAHDSYVEQDSGQ